jgi:membrane protein YqaA with SNARE-associated domain
LVGKILGNAERFANHRYATQIIFLLEFAGCTVIPLPVTLIVLALVTSAPARWLRFAIGAALGSTAGATLLYAIGLACFGSVGEWLIGFYGAEARWENIMGWFHGGWGVAFMFVAGVTTGFFRFASRGAGFTGMHPLLFVAAVAASRLIRYGVECGVVKFVGERATGVIGGYARYATAGALALFAATVLVFRLAV